MILLLCAPAARSQTPIHGIVNIYTPVIAFEECNGVEVQSSTGFSAGDTVLIIQMKGAAIDTTNTAAFGTIRNYGDAGNYEFGIVARVAPTTIFLRDSLLHHYTPSGIVQLVRVPHYASARVDNTLTAQPWNGTVGGVVAVDVTDELRLDADIDVTGLGFRGGALGISNENDITLYAAPLSAGHGGGKGEGIVLDDPLRNACRGARANGGGGGDAHNAGGAGGGNGGTGGSGGNQYSGYGSDPTGGVGGRPLTGTPDGDRIFFGGGGGGGHENDNVGTVGGNGGGIVIVRAARLTGNGHTIRSRGNAAKQSGRDGAGGGGAGGSVILDVPTMATPLTIDVNGSAGGSNDNSAYAGLCHGTGGGGGGGVLKIAPAPLPGGITFVATGGAAGLEVNATSSCYNTTYGAGAGNPGILVTGSHVPQSSRLFALPIIDAGGDTTICAGDSVQLHAVDPGFPVHWEPSAGLSCTNCLAPWVHPGVTTVYRLTLASGPGCYTPDSVTVTVLPLPLLHLAADTTICAGDSLLLDAGSGARYSWTPETGLDCPTCGSTLAHPAATTLYTVRAENARGCAVIDSILVTVADAGKLDLGSDRTICRGDTITIGAVDLPNAHWEPADGLSCADCAMPKASPDHTVTYRVTSRIPGSCPATGAITVTVREYPALHLSAERSGACLGERVTLTATGDGMVQWSPVTGLDCPTCASTVANPAVTTTYRCIMTNDAGCTSVDSITITVLPLPTISVRGDTTLCLGESAQLASSSNDPVTWSPADGLSCTDCSNPTAQPSAATIYVATAMNAAGCRAVDSVRVMVNEPTSVAVTIGRELHAMPGGTLRIPVMLAGPVDAFNNVTAVKISIGYDPGILVLRGADAAGELLQGWTMTPASTSGTFAATFTAPSGVHLDGDGALFTLLLDAYLGDVDSSALPLAASFPGARCVTVTGDTGSVRLDSICGLSFRLIEASGAKYALGAISPNPFDHAAEIEFSVGLEGRTTIEIFDQRGRRMARLVDGDLQPGRYSVIWEGSAAPTGLYYCRMTSGTWSGTEMMQLRK